MRNSIFDLENGGSTYTRVNTVNDAMVTKQTLFNEAIKPLERKIAFKKEMPLTCSFYCGLAVCLYLFSSH